MFLTAVRALTEQSFGAKLMAAPGQGFAMTILFKLIVPAMAA